MKSIKILPLSLAVAGTLTSGLAFADDDLVFSGYARFGDAYQASDSKLIQAEGAYTSGAVGRLGNEGNGGEFQFTKNFTSETGAIWDVAVMLNYWGSVGLAKFYAGGKNIFATQPDLYIWAGRDFHQRPQQGINDYFWMMHDGQGAGFKYLEVGDMQLDMGFVSGTDGGDDNGYYAITSRWHGIDLGSNSLEIYANYGFQSEDQLDADQNQAYQLGSIVGFGANRVILRYSHDSDNSVLNPTENLTTVYASFEGSTDLSENASMEYVASYHSTENEDEADDDRDNYGLIVRPMYFWDDVHSTWLEAGYNMVDYDNQDATNTAWKLTLSQNIAIGNKAWSRPMLRFYATVGNADNETENEELDTVTLGAMFESWW